MTATRADQIAALNAQLNMWRKRLRVLELQLATYGESAAPTHKILERNEAHANIASIEAQLTHLSDQPISGVNPYLGLLTFQEADAERFFGRDTLIADLVERAGKTSLLAVLGASGSGKSSVVRAGLIPALKRGALPGSERWVYLPPLQPGAHPLTALAALLVTQPGGAALGTVFDFQDRLASHADALSSLPTHSARAALARAWCW